MKILVCFKIYPDPDRILAEDYRDFSLHTDLSYAGLNFNCFDESALELALRIKESMAVQGENALCTALTVSDCLPDDFCQQLYSVGFDEVVNVRYENREFCPEKIGEILSRQGKEYDLILMGREAVMGESGMVPYLTAEYLGIPLESGVEDLDWNQGLTLRTREEGILWEKRVELPLLAVVGNSPAVLRGATLRQRMKWRGTSAKELETPEEERKAPVLLGLHLERCCKMLDPEDAETYAFLRELLLKSDSQKRVQSPKEEKNPDVFAGLPLDAGEAARDFLLLRKEKLILLPDNGMGRKLAAALMNRGKRSGFFGAEDLTISGKSAEVKKTCFGGNLLWEETLSLPAVVTVREFPMSSQPENLPAGETPSWILHQRILERPENTALHHADRVFICGNGVGTKENCEMVRKTAEGFYAGFGVTRPVALNGWGHMWELTGQSGLQISPRCCLTLGASGAGAFLRGIKNCQILIAVNTDPHALIFKYADYGIKMDAMAFLKKLTEKEEL